MSSSLPPLCTKQNYLIQMNQRELESILISSLTCNMMFDFFFFYASYIINCFRLLLIRHESVYGTRKKIEICITDYHICICVLIGSVFFFPLSASRWVTLGIYIIFLIAPECFRNEFLPFSNSHNLWLHF